MIWKLGITILTCLLSLQGIANESVGKWQRFSVSYDNPSWEGSPFDLEFRGVFTSPTGRILKPWGFYGGENTWRIYFMPDEVGVWTFKTISPDPELNGKADSFTCSPSRLPGKLTPDGNRWRLGDGKGDAPVLWNPTTADGQHWGFREHAAADSAVAEAIRFADEVVGARVIGFHELLIIPTSWAKEWPQDSVPYVVGREGEEFHLPFWDNMNAKLDALRDRGMGHYIMFYSDDALTPDRFGITPDSPAERRLFRYAVARLACYPIVLWDTGIDIGEYRDNRWINGFAKWFNENDPWQHPTSSRSGGGSGGIMPETATYFSTGGADIPSRAALLAHLKLSVPTVHTDHWRPFIHRGNWNHDKIRIAAWRCALSGGQAAYMDYNQGPVDQAGVRLGGAYIGYATHFFRTCLKSDLARLVPHDELIVAGEKAILAADPGHEYVLYLLNGGAVTLDLSQATGTLVAQWYNPRSGETIAAKAVSNDDQASFASPTNDVGKDWVLHIYE